MQRHAFEAPASSWARFSRYVVRDGYIRPAPNADFQTYSPWELYRRAGLAGATPAPHRALLAVLSGINLLGPTPEAEAAVLDWCRHYGLLGLLLQDVQMAVLAPRWSGSPPGLFVHEDAKTRLIQPIARRFIRNVRGWTDRTDVSTKAYSSDQVDDGQLVSSDQIPAKWRTQERDQPWALRRATNGDWLKESLETTWGRFFPDVPEAERETYSYPAPNEPEFWRLYAEPVDDFLRAAANLHQTLRTFETLTNPKQAPKASANQPAGTNDPMAAQQAVLKLDSLFSAVHPCLHFTPDGTPQLQWNSASLLGSIAMMAIQDVLAGSKLIVCANHKCSNLFLGRSYQARFCSDRCRQAVQKRAYRERAKARAIPPTKHQGTKKK